MIALFQMFPPPHPRKLHVPSPKMYHKTHLHFENDFSGENHSGKASYRHCKNAVGMLLSLCANTPTQQHPDCEFKRKTTKNKRLPSKDVLAYSQST